MKKRNLHLIHLLTVGVFLGFIGILTVTNLFTSNGEFSANENRYLSQFPQLRADNIFSGSFDTEFETWFSDQFIHRDAWIERKAAVRKAAGAIENNGVYFASDHRLIQQFLTADHDQISRNIDILKDFSQETGMRLNIILVPGASYGEKKYLPGGAYNVNEANLLTEIGNQLESQNFIDISAMLGTSGANYFRTDHHWNESGAKVAYDAICRSVLKKESRAFAYTEAADDFKGTMYSRSGAFWTPADSIMRIDPVHPLHVAVTFEDGTKMYSLYTPERLLEKDKYTYYVDGNHAYVHIATDAESQRRAIIIKDSYAHILIPYLACEYSEIDMFDLRYYNGSVSEYIRDKENTDIYVIYGVETFSTDRNLAILW